MFQISKYALLSKIIYVLMNFHVLLILFSKIQLISPGFKPQMRSRGDPRSLMI